MKKNKQVVPKSLKRRAMMLISLASETARWARMGFKTRTAEEQEKVISICEKCEFYSDVRKLPEKVSCRSCFSHLLGPRCTKCGCCMKIKKMWITAHCPIDKW